MKNCSNLVEAYLNRLRARLVRRIPADVAAEHVEELRQHLRQSIVEKMQTGLSENEASIASLRRLGSDALIADGFIRSHSGISDLSAWRFAWIPTFIGIAYCLIPLWFTDGPTPDWLPLVLWLPTCFLVVFSYACWRSRRFLLAPVAVGAAVVFCCLILQSVAFSSIGLTRRSQEMRERSLFGYRRQVADRELAVEQAKALMAVEGRRIATKGVREIVSPNWDRDIQWSSGPLSPIQREEDHGWVLSSAPAVSIGEAKSLWQRNGASYIETLKGLLRDDEANLHAFQASKLDAAELKLILIRCGSAVFSVWCAIATLNAGILGLGMLYRVAIARHWRTKKLEA